MALGGLMTLWLAVRVAMPPLRPTCLDSTHFLRCTSPRACTTARPDEAEVSYGDTRGAVLRAESVSISAGDKPLVTDAEWSVMAGEKWGLVGPNGAGKTTLLKSIAGRHSLDEGSVLVRPRTRVGYLQQTAVSGSTRTVFEEASSHMDRLKAATAALDAATAACEAAGAGGGEPSAEELSALDDAQRAFEAAGGFDAEARVSRVLDGLGFAPDDQQRPCSAFSGGWQMRIALARMLLSEPDLLLLDEPSNHLDASARAWLVGYLREYAGSVVLVSHDEAMLNDVQCVAEVARGRLHTYKGGYARYFEQRDARAAEAAATLDKQRRQAEKLQGFVDKWGAQATKASAANSRKKALAKLEEEMAAAPTTAIDATSGGGGGGPAPRFSLAPPPKVGSTAIKLDGAELGHGGAPILSDVSLRVARGARLLLLGPNGAGKSTLLHGLAGRLAPTAGARVEGEGLRAALFSQDLAQELDQEATAMDEVLRRAPAADEQGARDALGALGLSGGAALRPIGCLSGGEKARVALACFALSEINVLLLDEPNNHLDGRTLDALVGALRSWDGAVIASSHSRPFCEQLEITHTARVGGGRVSVFERAPSEDDWELLAGGAAAFGTAFGDPDAAAAAGEAKAAAKASRELERKAQKELSAAPKRIAALEVKLEEAEAEMERLDAEMMEAGADVERARELSEQRDAVQAKADEMFAEWERCEEILAAAA